MLKLSLRKRYFDAIKSGIKPVEGRLNDDEFKHVTRGMQICFTSEETGETLLCAIESMHLYFDFATVLQTEGVQHMLPGITNLQEAVEIYESFPGYKDGVKEFGALALRIHLN